MKHHIAVVLRRMANRIDPPKRTGFMSLTSNSTGTPSAIYWHHEH